jgi:hypothetical protein
MPLVGSDQLHQNYMIKGLNKEKEIKIVKEEINKNGTELLENHGPVQRAMTIFRYVTPYTLLIYNVLDESDASSCHFETKISRTWWHYEYLRRNITDLKGS